jgi:hypothetical protein
MWPKGRIHRAATESDRMNRPGTVRPSLRRRCIAYDPATMVQPRPRTAFRTALRVARDLLQL